MPRSYLQLSRPVSLLQTPQTATGANVLGQLPEGSIVQVITRQELAGEQSRWIKLQTCTAAAVSSAPSTAPSVTETAVAPLPLGAQGWILESELAQIGRTAEGTSCLEN